MEQREKHPVCWKSWFRTEGARSEILRLNKWFELTEIGIHSVSGMWVNEAADGDEGSVPPWSRVGVCSALQGPGSAGRLQPKQILNLKTPNSRWVLPYLAASALPSRTRSCSRG